MMSVSYSTPISEVNFDARVHVSETNIFNTSLLVPSYTLSFNNAENVPRPSLLLIDERELRARAWEQVACHRRSVFFLISSYKDTVASIMSPGACSTKVARLCCFDSSWAMLISVGQIVC